MNIYLGPLPQPWKGPVQVRGPEASASLAACQSAPAHFTAALLTIDWGKTEAKLDKICAMPKHSPNKNDRHC